MACSVEWHNVAHWIVPGSFRHFRIQHKSIRGDSRSKVRKQTKLPSGDNTWETEETWTADHSEIEGGFE